MSDQYQGVVDTSYFSYLEKYNIQRLSKISLIVSREFGGIMTEFYTPIRPQGDLDEVTGTRQPSLEDAKKKHWGRLFYSGFDHENMVSILKIGRVHSGIDLDFKWYIAGYQFVPNQVCSRIVRKYRFSVGNLSRLLHCLNKGVLLDLDVALSTYQQTLIDARQERTNQINMAIVRFKGREETALADVERNAQNLKRKTAELSSASKAALEEVMSTSAASDVTSASAQTVAPGTEEISNSIFEISQQLGGASQVEVRTKTDSVSTSDEVVNLPQATQKNADVAGPIQVVAEQMNPPRLNATVVSEKPANVECRMANIQKIRNFSTPHAVWTGRYNSTTKTYQMGT